MTLDELLERASGLTDAQVEALEAARGRPWDERVEARRCVQRVVPEKTLDRALEAALGAVPDRFDETALYNILDVVGDAVLALVAKDLISEEHFQALYGPWASVMER